MLQSGGQTKSRKNKHHYDCQYSKIHQAMPFIALPPEITLRIAECLTNNRDINALARCDQRFYGQLNGFLYRRNRNGLDVAAPWAVASKARIDTLRRIEKCGLNLADSRGDILHKASKLGQLDVVRYILNSTSHIDIESWGADGFTPLLEAVWEGRKDMVQLLLDCGADPSRPSQPGWVMFPLQAAIERRHVEIATLLALNGASLSAVGSRGWTPLLDAANMGLRELAETLLDLGADIHYEDSDGHGVIELAIWGDGEVVDNLEMFFTRGAPINSQLATTLLRDELLAGGRSAVADLLLKYGANPNFAHESDGTGSDHSRQAPLTRAVEAGYFAVATALVQYGANFDAQDEQGKTALHHAYRDLHIPSAKLLLDAGADAHILDKEGNLAMMLAESPEIVEMMLAKGVDINHVNNGGCTALINAAIHGNIEVARLLIKAGADVHLDGGQGWTALCAAVGNNHEYIATLLLEAGADPNDERSGHPALFDAVYFDSPGLVQVLVKHGAEISKVCSHHNTALRKAVRNENRMAVECLLKNGADVHAGKSPLLPAIANGDLEMARLLLDHGANVEKTDYDGYTPLFRAVDYGHEQIVDLLLSKGANLQVVDHAGAGANLLSLAAGQGDSSVVSRLLNASKQNLDFEDLYGRTPLFRAAMRGHEPVVERLLTCDPMPDIHKKDNWGATALAMASRNGHTGIVHRLLRIGQYSVEVLKEKDKAGRGIYTGGTEQRVDVHQDGMASEEGETVVLTFNPDTCYCDICGRCSTCKNIGQTMTCKECHTDGGGDMLICCFCVAAGLKCLKPDHTWVTFMGCVCQEESSDNEEEEDDEEDDGEENDNEEHDEEEHDEEDD